jgi:hypothetical protein
MTALSDKLASLKWHIVENTVNKEVIVGLIEECQRLAGTTLAQPTVEREKIAQEWVDEYVALRDAIAWRPIETAPLDYSVVLLYQPATPGHAEAVGQGHRVDLRAEAHDKWVFQANGWLAEPTHWQPLPAPPTSVSSTHRAEEPK